MKSTLVFVGLLVAGCSVDAPSVSEHRAPVPQTELPTSIETQASVLGPSIPSGLRPQYQRCVDAAAGVVPDTQECIGVEFTYLEGRLAAALKRRLRGPESNATAKEQAAWRKTTDERCAWNAEEEGQGQRLEANACELEAIAARADQLSH